MLSRLASALVFALFGVFALSIGRAGAAQTEEHDVTILVVDPRGQPVESYGWSLRITTPRFASSSSEPSKSRPGGLATLRLPVGPATIEIQAERYKSSPSIPLPPTQGAQPLRIVIQPVNEVSGRVIVEGVPVAGAQVELVQRDPNLISEKLLPGYWDGLYFAVGRNVVRSDAEGNFRIRNDYPQLKYFAHAWTPGCAEGFAGPVTPDGAPLTVELSVGSALEGTLRLPGGRSADGLGIELYRKRVDTLTSDLGLVFRAPVDATGRWKIDSLAAGPWLARVRWGSAAGLDVAFVQRSIELPWIFDAPRGGSGRADIDLGAEALCTLDGTLTVGALIRAGYAELLLEGPIALKLGMAGIDPGGHFVLRTRQPGRYRVVVHGGPQAGADKPVTDLVELVPGMNTWKRTLPPESWKADGVRLDAR